MNWDRANTISIWIFTLVATAAGIKSCSVSVSVEHDQRQLDTLHSIATQQQEQLKALQALATNQQNQLSEMQGQTKIIAKEYSEMKGVGLGISTQTTKLSDQLKYSQRLEDQANRNFLMRRIGELAQLKMDYTQMKSAYEKDNSWDNSRYSHSHFFMQAQTFLERISKYEVLLQDSSLFSEWINIEGYTEYCANSYENPFTDSLTLSNFFKRMYDQPVMQPNDLKGLKQRQATIDSSIIDQQTKELDGKNRDFMLFRKTFYSFMETKLQPFIDKKFNEYYNQKKLQGV